MTFENVPRVNGLDDATSLAIERHKTQGRVFLPDARTIAERAAMVRAKWSEDDHRKRRLGGPQVDLKAVDAAAMDRLLMVIPTADLPINL